MNIHPCHTLRSAEQALLDTGKLDSDELMDIAISECIEQLQNSPEYHDAAQRFACAIVYTGKGKNAGDAIGIARELGFGSIIIRSAVSPRLMARETRRQLEITGEILQAEEPPHIPAGGALILDGLLGSGASGELRAEYAQLVEEMNQLRDTHANCRLLAVDIPTGLHADHGIGTSPFVRADATLAIGCVKPGMVADGAEDAVGRLICVPLPEVALPESDAEVTDSSIWASLPRRRYSCYKNQAGRVCIIAGSPGYTGAAELCTEAALAAGAGLVELYCLPSIYPILASRLAAEVIVRPVSSYTEVTASGADALVIGPGLGTPDAANTSALQALVEAPPCPLVLDADGLNLAAAHSWRISPRSILTPHPGEMRRLSPATAQLPRAERAAQYVREHPCTLLLKGARTLITDGTSMIYNSTGGPQMANGGQGDVLSGVIAAFLAQGAAALQAAALGAYCCGRAADIALRNNGSPLAVNASRLFPYLTARDTI